MSTDTDSTVSYTTIRLHETAKEELAEEKRPEETWTQFLLRLLEDTPDELSEEDVRTIAERVVEDKVVDGALR